MDVSLSTLSGGWRMRAALARALININKVDILLLDEATNHCTYNTIDVAAIIHCFIDDLFCFQWT